MVLRGMLSLSPSLALILVRHMFVCVYWKLDTIAIHI